jgi:hypothetical protein
MFMDFRFTSCRSQRTKFRQSNRVGIRYEVRPDRNRGLIFASRDNTEIWTATNTEYRLTKWDATLKEARTLLRKPSWWSSFDGHLGSPSRPPSPVINAVHVDQDGLIWVFVRIAGKRWREAWPRNVTPAREVGYNEIEHEKLHATLIEVVDPVSLRVLSRKRIDEYVLAALPGRRFAAYAVNEEGSPQIRIFDFSLTR